MRNTWILVAAVALAACKPSAEKLMANIAVAELKSELRDPASLQLSDTQVQIADGWGAICGKYNAANAFGGMVGAQRFVRVFSPEEMEILTGENASNQKFRTVNWDVAQTKFEYEEKDWLEIPIENRPIKQRGLFMETLAPTVTIGRIADRCAAKARPMPIEP